MEISTKIIHKTAKIASFLILTSGLSLHAFDHNYKKFDQILKSQVKKTASGYSTKINYKSIKTNPNNLQKVLNELSSVSEKEFQTFNQNQQLSFLINAYNAFTIKLIIDNYPVKSIKKIGGVFSSPWKKEFFQLRGKNTSLDAVEHEMLRKDYIEPRIHFGVNCASVGCPPLRAEAFVATKINDQLNEQALLFLNNPEQNTIDKINKKIVLSKIFSWFEGDFKKQSPSVVAYVLKIWGEDSSKAKDYDLDFRSYNWDLNEK
jgi:hypothetical protein